ncbi:MAG: TRAM domain-containing protein [archaeon]|nr:TRAM domain-containing protein [archaeon]MCP8306588.1 TRAM domain-containing protein [archaeon]
MGKEYDVSITEISRRGDGVAKIEGFIVFVPETKVGQKARIKIVQMGNRHANGQIVEAVEKEEEAE